MSPVALATGERFALAAFNDPLVQRIVTAGTATMLTGAGMSAPSGLPTFRGPTGMYDTIESGRPPVYLEDLAERPEVTAEWNRRLASLIDGAQPNAGHRAIARAQQCMRSSGGDLTVATMNVDRLHEIDGASVSHLHGLIDTERCSQCNTTSAAQFQPDRACECGGVIRTDVTLFGEPTDAGATALMRTAVAACDVFYAVGVSGMTATPWQLVHRARSHNTITVLISKDPDPEFAAAFDVVIDDSAANLAWYLPGTGGST